LSVRVGIISLGSLKSNYIRHAFTVLLLDVKNIYIRRHITTKSRLR